MNKMVCISAMTVDWSHCHVGTPAKSYCLQQFNSSIKMACWPAKSEYMVQLFLPQFIDGRRRWHQVVRVWLAAIRLDDFPGRSIGKGHVSGPGQPAIAPPPPPPPPPPPRPTYCGPQPISRAGVGVVAPLSD